MAGGIDWFRWHHGSVTDQKFPLIAKRAGASVAEVIAVWACLLEAASQNAGERGVLGEPDFEAMDCALGIPEGRATAIFEAMRQRNLVDENLQVTAWPRRQPKRERDDDSSTERVRAFRAKHRHETPRNTTERIDTPTVATERAETPRGEERREENYSEAIASVSSSTPCDPRADEKDLKANLPDCPHLEVLALWAEVLPAMPQHQPSLWSGTRASHLRARWRETAAAKGWRSQDDGLVFLRKLFAYVGKSEFLTGKVSAPAGRKPFQIELEWLVNATNWARVIEGKYHNEVEVAA